MRTEDVQPFTVLMREVARTCRAKVTDDEIAAYFRALDDMPFSRIRERMTELQRTQKFFPSVATIRQQEEAEASGGPAPYSPDWWRNVRQNERAIVAAEIAARRTRRGTGPEDSEVLAAERSLAAAARGCAVHAGTDEEAEWAKKYAVAALQNVRVKAQRQLESAKEEPPSTSDAAREAREKWARTLMDITAIALDSCLNPAKPRDQEQR